MIFRLACKPEELFCFKKMGVAGSNPAGVRYCPEARGLDGLPIKNNKNESHNEQTTIARKRRCLHFCRRPYHFHHCPRNRDVLKHSMAMSITKEIHHQYDELLPTSLPGVEVHVIYECESQITYDHEGNEESNILIAITCTVNGVPADVIFPEAKDGQATREFLALLRESARDALYAQELRDDTAALLALHNESITGPL